MYHAGLALISLVKLLKRPVGSRAEICKGSCWPCGQVVGADLDTPELLVRASLEDMLRVA
jgi:hypothetical protein